jgi:hypothetical protein
MRNQGRLLILALTLLVGSLAVGAIWQTGDDDPAPASRSIFPKVLNH